MRSNKFILVNILCLGLSSCSGFLDLEPLDKVPSSTLLNDKKGIILLLSNLYNQLPIEDFSYYPDISFNYHGGGNNSNLIDRGHSISFFTDESVNSLGRNNNGISEVGPINDGYWPYNSIRNVNQFLNDIEKVEMDNDERNRLRSEAHFIRAYYYYGLVKRYGGVPLITDVQKFNGDDLSNLFVPRSTEKETWDFILKECDLAIEYLPKVVSHDEGLYRATKWTALALKSRIALHAASIAKYWNKAPLSGIAVDSKLVGGMSSTDFENYYSQCIKASEDIIKNSGKELYKLTPSNINEAIDNYKKIFESPESSEVFDSEILFMKSYIDGSNTQKQGHSTDAFFNPRQTTLGGKCGRFSPSLDLVDLYESYLDNGEGKSCKLATRTDGNENEYISHPENGIDLSIPYKKYDNISDIFEGKDARLYASIITPGSLWKNVEIIMQAGLITKDGISMIYQEGSSIGKDGVTYYTYGAPSDDLYSGFKYVGTGLQELANYSSTGFSLKKFLQESKQLSGTEYASTTPFIDLRLSEIYLNYAEAVLESGLGDKTLAAECLNKIRRRAGHTDDIDLNLENVLKERRIELAFEGQRYWDLVRRRDYHLIFNGSNRRKSLLPILDLREDTPKYIFVRAENMNDLKGSTIFYDRYYYRPIPGTTTNKLIQNPQY